MIDLGDMLLLDNAATNYQYVGHLCTHTDKKQYKNEHINIEP